MRYGVVVFEGRRSRTIFISERQTRRLPWSSSTGPMDRKTKTTIENKVKRMRGAERTDAHARADCCFCDPTRTDRIQRGSIRFGQGSADEASIRYPCSSF